LAYTANRGGDERNAYIFFRDSLAPNVGDGHAIHGFLAVRLELEGSEKRVPSRWQKKQRRRRQQQQ